VHQDGLVHISAMSRTFIKDPREVAKPGDIVKVKVLDVDKARKRIALTMRLEDEPGAAQPRGAAPVRPDQRAHMQKGPPRQSGAGAPAPGAMGGALAEAMRRAAEKRK
jgi:uncharacterized protein